jgi:hypothetical protein
VRIHAEVVVAVACDRACERFQLLLLRGETDGRVLRWSVSWFVRTLARAPTNVTSKPSRIQVMPRPTTINQCHRLQGNRSRRLGINVSTTRPVEPSSPVVLAELIAV